MRRFLLCWLPVLVWAGIIFYFSSQSSLPHAQAKVIDYVLKKAAHFLEFAVLAGLLLRAFRTGEDRSLKPYLLAFGAAFLYALSDEIHQSRIPERTPSLLDVTIDTVASAAGLVAARLGRRGPGAQ